MRTIHLGIEVWMGDVVAASHDELLVSAHGATTDVRLARLPVETTRVLAEPQGGARTDSGAWLLFFHEADAMERGGSRVAWLAPGATHPSDESRAPIVIEMLLAFGDAIIAVPRLEEKPVRPWIHENGAWRELDDVPARAPTGENDERATARTLRLDDRTFLLFWNGGVFERRDGRFVRAFEARVDVPWYQRWQPVADGSDGFYHLVGGLFEVRKNAQPVKHLDGVLVTDIAPGPDRTLLVLAYSDLLVYEPRARTIAVVPSDVFSARRESFFSWTPVWLVTGRLDGGLALIPAEDFADLAREPADAFVARRAPPPTPPRAMDGALPFSRARVVAHDDRIAIIASCDLRAHTVDRPQWKRDFSSALVSVALSADAYGVLDEEGVLHVVAVADGAERWRRAIAPNPRALVGANDETFVVLASSGVFFADEHETRRIPFEAPIAAAVDDRGRVLVSGEHGRVAVIEGEAITALPSLEADARAVAFANRGWLAVAGFGLHRCEGGTWTRIDDGPFSGRFLVARRDGRAYATGATPSDAKCIGEGEVCVSYGETYSQPESPLTITGLAFLDDGRMVVALDDGRGNIVSPEHALKLDEHPGDVPSRWWFLHPKGILIAG